MHGLTHVAGGPDPIPGLLPRATDYASAIINHPCAQHYWPCDETTGDLLDRIGGWHLARTAPHTVDTVSYPVYTGDSVENAATAPPDSGDTGRFHRELGADARPYWANDASRTIELWLYLDAYPTGMQPCYPLVNISVATGSFQFFVVSSLSYSEDAAALDDPAPFPLDTWQHVAAVADAGTVSLYRGGVLVDSGADGNATGGGLTLLNRADVAAPWKGQVRHVAFYDCALTDADMSAHITAAANFVPAGYVLTADGAGGSAWMRRGVPDYTGASEGDVLTIVDGVPTWQAP